MKSRKCLVAVALVAVLLAQPLLAREAHADPPASTQFATGFASFIISPVYGAFKVAFAMAGTIVGGFTWVFTGGDTKTAQKVWDPSLKGTYVISPEHMAGKQEIRFIGSSPTRS